MALLLIAIAGLLLRRTDSTWHNPIEGARFQSVTDFDGVARDAALSRDGQLIAFLSDHDGQMDVWVNQVGSGQFHNLTRGSVAELVNPQVRTLGFSPDSSMVTFWVRNRGESNGGIGIWAVPTLGGQPRPFLEGMAELDWSQHASRLAYHTPGPGDPLFVSDGLRRSATRPIFEAPAGLHSHFPLWSPDDKFIYFVQGALPDNLDIWRIESRGGSAERIHVPLRLCQSPGLWLIAVPFYISPRSDGSVPLALWYGSRGARTPHRPTSGPEHYTSLAQALMAAGSSSPLPLRKGLYGFCQFLIPSRRRLPLFPSHCPQAPDFFRVLGRITCCMPPRQVGATVSGNTAMESEPSCGVLRAHTSWLLRQFPQMDSSSPFQFGKMARIACT